MPPTTRPSSGWKRLKRGEKCPVCAHAGWCTISGDGEAAKCMRLANDRPVKGGGWVHKLQPGQAATVKTFTPEAAPKRTRETWLKLATRFRANGKIRNIDKLADDLGVSAESLHRLRIGWAGARELKELDTRCRSTGAWSFPMRTPDRHVVGIRLRTASAFKYAVAGSGEGLFIPSEMPLDSGEIHVVEGPTSTAALLTMGFVAIGRPSCSGGVELVKALVRAADIQSVIVWGDRDTAKPLPGGRKLYPGQDGARALARQLAPLCAVRVVIPPVKDARDWLRAGADRATVERTIGLRKSA